VRKKIGRTNWIVQVRYAEETDDEKIEQKKLGVQEGHSEKGTESSANEWMKKKVRPNANSQKAGR